MEELSRRVAAEEEDNGVARATRKSARYLMYRKWVGEKWGYLGRVEPSEPLATSESGCAALLAYVGTPKGKGIAKYLPFA